MTAKDLAEECSIARTLAVIGDRWSLLILRDGFYGVRRFEDFQRDLGVARNILSDRLAKLVERGVFDRRPYAERPPRHEYRLTAKGRALLPVLLTMMRWGDDWEGEGAEPPVKLIHTTCGHATHAVLDCAHCGEALSLSNVYVDPIRIAPRDRSHATAPLAAEA
jgi:DNA-binding HxlR family transcriptional regulator